LVACGGATAPEAASTTAPSTSTSGGETSTRAQPNAAPASAPNAGANDATDEVAPTPAASGEASATRSEPETSVRPGVNDRYFQDGALKKYSAIFEGESREVARSRDAILAALRIEPGMHVADLGAGTGLFTFFLAREVGPEGRVHAVDIVPAFLDRLRGLAAEAETNNVRVVQGQERATGLDEASVDLAVLINVYHHLEYPRSYMRSVMRTLRPGGRLIVIDFHRIEGVTAKRMLEHVRANRETVLAEIESVGFALAREEQFLKQNYFLEFRKR
jgi:ubiquinone/menaquinone biosynthesis C-methylase UbiE